VATGARARHGALEGRVGWGDKQTIEPMATSFPNTTSQRKKLTLSRSAVYRKGKYLKKELLESDYA
jgi:hypothetical protein